MTKQVVASLYKQFMQLVRYIHSEHILVLTFDKKGSTADFGYLTLMVRPLWYLYPNVIFKDESISHTSFVLLSDLLKVVFIYAYL